MPRSEAEVYDVLSALLLSGALPPGQRLGEREIAEPLGVSRERVRKVLQRLGVERLVTMIPNRGAFVATPSLETARTIYDARRILEAGLLMTLGQTASPKEIERLRAHLAEEHLAAAAGDRARGVQLSGAFHLRLAEMAGNEFIQRYMQELVSRTAMLVALFETGAPDCGVHEHAEIVDALERHDGPRAAQLGTVHLSMIETRLKPRADARPQTVDVVELLRKKLATQDEKGSTDKRRNPLRSDARLKSGPSPRKS
jgi:DNA-binding GntR family transcriptional regulator